MRVPISERMLRPLLACAAVAMMVPLPSVAEAQSFDRTRIEAAGPRGSLQREIAQRAGPELREFYAARSNRPLWFDEMAGLTPAADTLLEHLATADRDGLTAPPTDLPQLGKLLDKARRGKAADLAKAEIALSAAFASYVRATRGADREAMIYESAAVAPSVPTVRAALDAAARGGPLDSYVQQMRWMHPLYAPMREALADPQYSAAQHRLIAANLARLRAIPALNNGRHILVDTASAQLFMYENGRVVDTMKVVVGKPEMATPMMAGTIRTAVLNPYWNVPEDLVRSNIAANVLSRGVAYLRSGGYQVLSDYSANPRVLDARKIDWQAVREGRQQVRVRQLPGAANFMGKVKFEFPNAQGIYLHDTPDKHLMAEDARQFSSGCVRLEDAARLHQWLMGTALPARMREVEQEVQLPQNVPVYITYLTAMPEGGTIAFHHDPYARDGVQFAALDGSAAGGD
jgi:murein L,D-transpeptidase YcbB/YkuD